MLASLLVALTFSVPQAQWTKSEDALSLIRSLGLDATGRMISDLGVPIIEETARQQYPDLTEDERTEVLDEVAMMIDAKGPVFVRALAELYAERFSHENIRTALVFFRTDTGQKLAAYRLNPAT